MHARAPLLAAILAATAVIPITVAGGADDCFNADPILGEGAFAFDNVTATTDGPAHAACTAFGQMQISNDVWFCWSSDFDDAIVVETCGGTSVDSKIAVYADCVCPPTDADLVECNDDACDIQSRVIVSATSGQPLLMRIGTFPGAGGGTGTFSVTACPGDADLDGHVNVTDLGIALANFGQTVAVNSDGDLTGDGQVNIADLGELLAYFGTTCI